MIDDMEVIVFKVITASGIAKGLAYKALDKVENRDFKGAYKLLGEANEYIDEAHETQKGIIEDEVTGNATAISTLLLKTTPSSKSNKAYSSVATLFSILSLRTYSLTPSLSSSNDTVNGSLKCLAPYCKAL